MADRSEEHANVGPEASPAFVVSGSTEGSRSLGTASRPRSWVGIVANPGAGRGKGRVRVRNLIKSLGQAGLHSRVAWTVHERRDLVEESSHDRHCRCLVAVGGDGTVASLINEAPKVPITVLPSGTENLFARYYRLGRDPKALAATIAAGRVVNTDVGLMSGRRFGLMAGFGFDADVVTRHHLLRIAATGLPRPTNRAAYVEPVLHSSFCYRFPPMAVTVTDPGLEETLVGTTVFVFNLPSYALGLPFAPTARGDDGFLDLVVFRKPGAFQALHYLWLVLRGLHLKRPGVEHRRVRRITIESTGTVPVQLDGDPGGFLNGGNQGAWTAEVEPSAVGVLVPSTFV